MILNNRNYCIINDVQIYKRLYYSEKNLRYIFTQYLFNHKIKQIHFFVLIDAIVFRIVGKYLK